MKLYQKVQSGIPEQACDGHERTTDSYGREKKVADITDFILKEPLFDNRNGGKDG